jgi:putative oxidoreductase
MSIQRVLRRSGTGDRELNRLPEAELLAPFALPLLRILMGIVFVWFGALKVAGTSPVGDLVARTLPWVDRDIVVPALGTVEVLLGLGLVFGLGLRLVLPFAAAHLAGTFLTFVMVPSLMFRHSDPMLLTADGEFVLKNLVLISAALVLIALRRGPASARG